MPPSRPMAFFDRLFRWLFVAPPKLERYGDPELDAIDLDRIAAAIDLDEEARRLGEAELPGTADTELTGVESQIVRRVEKARQDYLSWAAGRLKALNQDLERRDLSPLLNKAGRADLEFERRASSLLSENGRVLSELADHARQVEAEFAAFRTRHGLSRPAVYPDGAHTFFRVSLLVLLVVIEGALNAVFFARGISTGLVGGFVYAGAFAFGNVAFASFWGRWLLPNLHHRHPLRKFLGLAGLLAALATALTVGLLIAHFRDALSAEAADAPALALANLRRAPFALREVHSWALFGVSLLFALIALVDSYGLDDPYPGYGGLDRRRREAGADYAVELDALRRALQELKDETLQQLDEALIRARTEVHLLHETLEHKIATEARLRHAVADVDHCLDTLLRTFRDRNRLYRKTPAPAYFSRRPQLAELDWPDFGGERDRRKYREQTTQLREFIARLEDIRAAIQSSFVRHHDGLKPLDAQFDPAQPSAPAAPGEDPA